MVLRLILRHKGSSSGAAFRSSLSRRSTWLEAAEGSRWHLVERAARLHSLAIPHTYLSLSPLAQFGSLLPLPLLKHYFNVSNSYVLHKLRLVLFPWRHKPWSRAHAAGSAGAAGAYGGQAGYETPVGKGEGGFAPPREDVNSPDLYIPG